MQLQRGWVTNEAAKATALPIAAHDGPQNAYSTRTARAQPPHHTCGHCAPAHGAGALLACPDAQRALPKPFLTSPPHPETSGEVRSGTAAKRVRSVQQGKTQSQSQSQTRNPYRRPAASICHAPRGTRQHRQCRHTAGPQRVPLL
jgi:secreted PhoX family phosphatase